MKIEKYLVKKEYKEVVITQWIKPEGYKLAMCSLSCTSMKMDLNLFFGEYSEFKKFIKSEHDFDTEHETCIAMYVQNKKDGIVYFNMIIQKNDWLAEDYATIVHELHHFIHFALEEKGVNYGTAGEEVYAYLQGYFTELVIRAFVELKKVKKLF